MTVPVPSAVRVRAVVLTVLALVVGVLPFARVRAATTTPIYSVSVTDVTATEGNSGQKNFTFSVSVSPVPVEAVDVDYTTQDASLPSSGTNSTANAGSDYQTKTGTLHFDAGTTAAKSVGVVVLGDTLPEPNERFELVARIAGGSANQKDTGVGTITNDDGTPPSIRIADLSANEGDTGTTTFTFTVTRDGNTSQAVPFSWKTNDTTTGTDDAGSGTGGDYNPVPAATGTVNAGQTTTTVSVTVNGDTAVEGNETFTVDILQAANAAIGDASATATILDDDKPAVNFDDTVVGDEGRVPPVVGPDSGGEATATRTFKVKLATASGQTVTVDYATADDSATAPGDYTAAGGTLTFAPGETEKTFTVTVKDDSLNEATEDFLVNLANPTNAVLGTDGTAKGRIIDDDGTQSVLSVGNPSVNEPDAGTANADFVVSLDTASGVSVTVDYTATNGTATVGNDFTATSGTLTFAPGETSKTVTVPVKGDTTPEGNETFHLTLSNNTGADVGCTPTSTPSCGTATIVDNETVTVSAVDAATSEGNPPAAPSLTFTLTLSTPVAQPTDVDYHTADGTAKAGEDYTATTDTATIPANQSEVDVTVPLKADTFAEPTESFTLVLDSSNVAAIGDGSAVGEISDEDGTPPSVSIADASDDEAGTFTFTVTCGTITNPSGGSVHYTVTPGTAKAPDDLDAASGTAACTPADSTSDVTVNVKDDSEDEDEESFTVTLSDPSNLEIGDGQATGTITDNDGPDVAIDDVAVTEGNSGTKALTFTVTVSAPSVEEFDVDYAIADVTTDSTDYTASDGTLTFPAGDDTARTITVTVVGDTTDEPTETLKVTLSLPDETKATLGDAEGIGTITDDDGPTLSIGDDTTITEGLSGTTDATFTVSISAGSKQAVTVDYTTVNDTAGAPADYTTTAGTLTFAVDSATPQDITVPVKGDGIDEADETFKVILTNPQNATLADGEGVGTITDDDNPPTLSIGDRSVTETDHSAQTATLTVTLSAASGKTVTANYATRNGTATAPGDYTAKSGTLTFAPGETSKQIGVLVAGDTAVEPTETFFVDLSAPSNATIADGEGKVTIVDNDQAQETGQGYWLTGGDAGIFTFGEADFHGSMGGKPINQPIVGMAATPSGDGYWQVASDGGIFTFGDAPFLGSMGGTPLNQPVVGMASTPSGNGYWLVASDGGIFTFGDAPFLGSMGGTPLNQPVVGMASTPSGNGYWLVASDGGIFTFGDAAFLGSMGGTPLAAPVTGMAATPTGGGYWMVAEDGGIFTFGDAGFHGSAAGFDLEAPIVGMAATPSGDGYWLVGADGAVFAGGDAEPLGSMAGEPLNSPIVGMAAWPG